MQQFGSSRGPSLRRWAGVGLVALAAVAPACGDDTPKSVRDREQSISAAESTDAGPASAAEARRLGATVIDVRTPEEFAAGHVVDARNLDVQAATFADDIAALDRATTYVVYCRSGNRSAQAAATMRDAGITVFDGGGFDDMTAAGWPAS